MTLKNIDRRVFLRGGAGLVVLTGLGALTGCGLVGGNATAGAAGGAGDKTITIIVTESAPYQESTKIAAKLLAAKGWTLKPTYVTDIVQPNLAVSKGEFDFNYFQHGAYLTQFNKDNNLDIKPLFYVYGASAGVFSKKYKSVDELPQGAQIALPVDPANNGRAIKLLANAGKLKVDESKSVIHLSQKDITDNPNGYKFVEVDQQSLSKTLPDVDAGFLTIRTAAEIGLTRKDALLFEEEQTALPFIVIVAGTEAIKGTEKAKVLQEAYQSPEVREWFKNYQGGILPTPWDSTPDEDFKKWNNA